MSFIDINLNDVKDVTTVPEGEYKLACLSAEVKTSQSGNDYINLRFSVVDEPDAQDVYHIIMLPNQQDDEKGKTNKLRAIKRLFEACNVPTASPINLDTLVGQTCWATLVEEEDSYGKKNRIRRFTKSA